MGDTVEAIWECVCLLGRLECDDRGRARAAELIENLDPDLVHERIIASRVYLSARETLGRMEPTERVAGIRKRLDHLITAERQRCADARPELVAVLAGTRPFGARVMKGLALREHHPRPDLRHEGDIDLQVPGWRAALATSEWLRGRGWVWDTTEYSWLKRTDGGHLYGQLTLVLPDNDDPISRVDLHVGPYSVGHAGIMPLAGWRDAEVAGTPARVPDRETAIALIAAHALNDVVLSMKDVNDLFVLLAVDTDTDWATVEELCRGAQAADALTQLIAVTAGVYPELGLPAGDPDGPLVLEQTPQERADQAARYAYRNERERGADHDRATSIAEEGRRYYSADLRPRIAAPGQDVPPPSRNRWTCCRLLPDSTWSSLAGEWRDRSANDCMLAEETWEPDLTLITQGAGAVLRAGGEIFVPTVWGDVHPATLALAARLAGRA
jgi:putative nucleotidyltransferase-like protein